MPRYMTSMLLILPLAVIQAISPSRVCNSTSENWQSRIGILLSPIISGSKIREIEVYWNNVNFEPGDKISLYEEGPSGTPIVIHTITPKGPSGIEKTGVQADYVPSRNLSFVQKCSKYGVAWASENGVKKMDCHKTQPTWMKDRKNILGPLTISQVFLPGTHDSASYDVNGKKMGLISKFAVTQDLDILGQLVHGVRYLDIRVGHYRDSEEKFWTNHGPFYRSVSLKTVIDQVKVFLDNTEEIVIMDIREFPIGIRAFQFQIIVTENNFVNGEEGSRDFLFRSTGFNNLSDHRALVSYLEDEFRNYYLTNNRGWGISLNDIWSSGKRLIIGYENTRIVENHASMWPCVTHQWGNVRTVEDLYEYLEKIENDDRISRLRPRSAMAELTASLNDILFNRFGGLRGMAHKVNLNVTNWYSTIWQYTANIVAVDFVRGTDIVETAIKSNENRYLCCR